MLRVYAGSVEGPMGFGQKGGNATCSLGKGGGGGNGGGEAQKLRKKKIARKKWG